MPRGIDDTPARKWQQKVRTCELFIPILVAQRCSHLRTSLRVSQMQAFNSVTNPRKRCCSTKPVLNRRHMSSRIQIRFAILQPAWIRNRGGVWQIRAHTGSPLALRSLRRTHQAMLKAAEKRLDFVSRLCREMSVTDSESDRPVPSTFEPSNEKQRHVWI